MVIKAVVTKRVYCSIIIAVLQVLDMPQTVPAEAVEARQRLAGLLHPTPTDRQGSDQLVRAQCQNIQLMTCISTDSALACSKIALAKACLQKATHSACGRSSDVCLIYKFSKAVGPNDFLVHLVFLLSSIPDLSVTTQDNALLHAKQ